MKTLDQIRKKCQSVYNKSGISAVYEYCGMLPECNDTYCKGCECETPSHSEMPDECLVCGSAKIIKS